MAVIKISDSKSLPPVIKIIIGGTPQIFKVKTEAIIF
jgi:hypothetical protein